MHPTNTGQPAGPAAAGVPAPRPSADAYVLNEATTEIPIITPAGTAAEPGTTDTDPPAAEQQQGPGPVEPLGHRPPFLPVHPAEPPDHPGHLVGQVALQDSRNGLDASHETRKCCQQIVRQSSADPNDVLRHRTALRRARPVTTVRAVRARRLTRRGGIRPAHRLRFLTHPVGGRRRGAGHSYLPPQGRRPSGRRVIDT